MAGRIFINLISFALGASFTAGLFLLIAQFLRAQENAGAATGEGEDLEQVVLALPPPPPPPQKIEEASAIVPEINEVLALGFAEEPSSSPVKIVPSPPSLDELLPMAQLPTHVASGGSLDLESDIKPSFDVTFDETHIFQKSEVDKMPIPTSRPEPSVPASTLGSEQKRTVVVLFIVDTKGGVSNVRVLRSSNNREFDAIIVENVAEWTFSPAIKRGKAVRCMIQQQITVQMAHRDIFSL